MSYVQYDIANPSSAVSACESDWYLFKNSCYYRGSLSESTSSLETRRVCWQLNACSDLVSPNDELELFYVYTHSSRPSGAEYIGLMNDESGVLVNLDGTTVSFQPSYYRRPDAGDCFNIMTQRRHKLFARSCSSGTTGYVCESPTRCHTGSPCPAGWIALDSHCYFYAPHSYDWTNADTYCQDFQSGARLSSIPDMKIWKILKEAFGITETIWIGIHDPSHGGSYQAVDGTGFSISWAPGEPAGSAEYCVEMLTSDAANNVGCSVVSRRHMCRVAVTQC